MKNIKENLQVMNEGEVDIGDRKTVKEKDSNLKRQDARWVLPPDGWSKANFDGASKGNPGKARFGGIFRNHEGQPLLLYFGSIGWDTNNSAELEGLWQGMQVADQHNFYPILIEGDTQIPLNMATLIQQGNATLRVGHSWRLLARLETLETWIRNRRAINFMHVKRHNNKIVDLVTNIGVDQDQILHYVPLNIIDDHNQLQICTDLVHKEAQTLNAGGNSHN